VHLHVGYRTIYRRILLSHWLLLTPCSRVDSTYERPKWKQVALLQLIKVLSIWQLGSRYWWPTFLWRYTGSIHLFHSNKAGTHWSTMKRIHWVHIVFQHPPMDIWNIGIIILSNNSSKVMYENYMNELRLSIRLYLQFFTPDCETIFSNTAWSINKYPWDISFQSCFYRLFKQKWTSMVEVRSNLLDDLR